ncbi:MAG: hypothetical protein CMP11_08250 [Zetaproteobacteria bacterium]|nr:hypothetical protein [Pseudobdellovibrionaceae bacterium]|tara:strand:+ start:423 stop:1874 length:1452 start_codon:yes stop_codon:yes gene_type:complete
MKIIISFFTFLIVIILNFFVEEILIFFLQDVSDYITNISFKTLQVLLFFSFSFFLNSLIARFFWGVFVKKYLLIQVPTLIYQCSNFIVYIITLAIVLELVFDSSFLSLIATFGAFSIVLAFGLRGLTSDLMTGLALNLEQPFKIGEWVSFKSPDFHYIGKIIQINWRVTHIVLNNGNYILIPNRSLGDCVLINFSKHQFNRYELNIDFDYNIADSEIKRILYSAVNSLSEVSGFVEQHMTDVFIDEIHKNGVKYLVRYWIIPWEKVTPSEAKHIVQSKILQHLRLSGITPSHSKIHYFEKNKPEIIDSTRELQINILKSLRAINLFSDLKDDEIDHLSKVAKQKLWKAEDILVNQGEKGDSMFIVLEGLLDVSIDNGRGAYYSIAMIEAGDIFGEMSLLTGEDRSARVKSLTQTLTVEISRSHFKKILDERKDLCQRISEIIVKRNIDLEKKKLKMNKIEKEERIKKESFTILKRIISFFDLD